ncbi:methyl-accepting chemotaxis protein [Azoarcus sp. L1K30]|uniref:methyl-accepting chemotaxis protein n=1 Tax=Azoarcus sp. L1K30 TaxID=2820277 RepID=UPI001B815C7B|nr:PAS domain-containing methyl-accepting chemotaxis protein [Azoarcus sp. L1K30]MBR0565335.1 methyl-accepting chemotaxis protein [Azoarcus sp. L1K30]
MRNPAPVIDVETLLPEGEFIYSRTDLDSIIIEANDAFAKISAYRPEEMVGQPHNIVRHPDMPAEAFADMWRDLKAGRPWRGIVKNRRSDGGFYWVVANASPVRENGRVVGYQSVRGRPDREEVAAAEVAYKRIKAGDRSICIRHGRVVPARTSVWAAFNSAKTQLLGLAVLTVLLSLVVLGGQLARFPFHQELATGVAVLAVLWATSFLFLGLPRLGGDISSLHAYVDHLLVSGDLRKRFVLARHDLVGDIARSLDRFVSSVQATVQGMSDSAKQVANVSSEVGCGVGNVSDAAHVQSDATSSAAAGIQQITVSIGEVAAHAAATRSAAELASEVSARGSTLSAKASETILALADTVKHAAGQVEFLGAKSAEISRITGVISDIADQTNLLALNAAIEAARAGEQGRGFAVVADEVRKLAERTGNATKEISTMVSAIQAETGKAVSGMRQGAAQVESGVQLVQDAQGALLEINTQMGKTLGMVNDITHSSAEQNNAMAVMAQSVERVASMTDQNMSVVAQTRAAVGSLDRSVERMKMAMGQFTV